MTAKVNYSAEGTWLEPYIGHELKIKNTTKYKVCIIMDYGDRISTFWLDKKYFNLK